MKENIPLIIVHALMCEFVEDVTKLSDADLEKGWEEF